MQSALIVEARLTSGSIIDCFGKINIYKTNSGKWFRQSLLFAKACPEPDLKYRSNSTAFDLSEKARQVTSIHGFLFIGKLKGLLMDYDLR